MTGAAPAGPAPRAGIGRHVPELDGVRGVAILLVVWYHALLGIPGLSEPTLLDLAYQRLRLTGWAGVDLFFVLSGFLITGILLDAKGRAGFFRRFYIRRTLRIFPVYYAFLAVVLGLGLLLRRAPGDDWDVLLGNQAWLWTYTSNVLVARDGMAATPFVGHLWSLAVEEQFYLVWPLVVFLTPRHRLPRVAAACIAGALALRVASAAAWPGLPAMTLYVLTPFRMDALAMGAFLAAAAREPGWWPVVRRWAPAALAAGAAGVLALVAVYHVFSFRMEGVRTWGFTATALLSAGLIALALDPRTRIAAAARLRWLQSCGKYSYAIYIFHVPIAHGLLSALGGPRELPTVLGSRLLPEMGYFLLLLALSYCAARLSWRLLEKPCLDLKEKLAPQT